MRFSFLLFLTLYTKNFFWEIDKMKKNAFFSKKMKKNVPKAKKSPFKTGKKDIQLDKKPFF